ncbi:hypothetical protein [Coleofasciculus sp. G1-WW12-02]|uniref:hypothetical protein n=1 Tax=Coleofasciculus sp. G1-WW12-02 TaxID=3068483 RepID=UPI0040630381
MLNKKANQFMLIFLPLKHKLALPSYKCNIKQEEAIEIAATQTKSACADWVLTGVANPDLVLVRGDGDS